MSVYLVTYDLNAPGQDYGPLLKAIRSYTHCDALKSAYLIDSTEAAAALRDKLMLLIDKNDALYVLKLRRSWGANRTMKCTTWLKDAARTWD